MREVAKLPFEILEELKIVRKHLETLTQKEFKAGKRFDLL